MDASLTEHLLSTHHHAGVPFSLSLPFLLKVDGYSIRRLQADSKLSNAVFHRALHGENWPNERLRYCLHDRLGLDPFAWGEQNGAWQCRIPAAKRRRRS